ncbi:MAG: HlyD family efflux transporter periplasmic adaptor subunit [Planctomycetota bacterium]
MVKAIVWFLVFVLIGCGAAYFFIWSPPDAGELPHPVQLKTIWRTAHGAGLIEGYGAVTRLKFPFAGIVDEIEAKEGGTVKLNDTVAKLNSTEADDHIALEEIALKEAKAKRDAITARKNAELSEKKEAELKRAHTDTLEAERNLSKLKTPEKVKDRQDRQEDAKLALEHAQRALALAEAEEKQLLSHPTPLELEAADARLNLAKTRNDEAKKSGQGLESAAAEMRYALADYDKIKKGASDPDKEAAGARTAQAKSAVDRAEAEKRRIERPDAPIPVPVADIELATKTLADAQAREDLKRKELESLRHDADSAESRVADALVERSEQNLKSFKKMKLGYELRAPFEGLVIKRLAEPGALLAPYEDVLWIVDFTRKRVRAEFDIEKLQSLIKKDLKASIKSRAFGKAELSARVVEIGKAGTRKLLQDDPSQPRGGEVVEVIMEIDSPTDADKKPLFEMLRPGLRVEADIVLESRANVLCVPKSYLGTDPGENGVDKKYVMKVNPNAKKQAAKKQEVNCGIRDEYYVEILDGLNTDDLVVRPKAQNK